jgi:hypothetical protein
MQAFRLKEVWRATVDCEWVGEVEPEAVARTDRVGKLKPASRVLPSPLLSSSSPPPPPPSLVDHGRLSLWSLSSLPCVKVWAAGRGRQYARWDVRQPHRYGL